MKELQEIYLTKISEALNRLSVCERLIDLHSKSNDIYELESAALQIRKALEAVAFAAIAPNKIEYASFRAGAERNPDYTKDYNARSILQFLTKVNADFYPKPISGPISKGPGKWHFDRRDDSSLTKKQFERFYDRLGKHLHSDNPWGTDKGLINIVKDISKTIASTRLLLSLHFTTIRTTEFTGIWVVEAPNNGNPPKIITGQADGDFVVT